MWTVYPCLETGWKKRETEYKGKIVGENILHLGHVLFGDMQK